MKENSPFGDDAEAPYEPVITGCVMEGGVVLDGAREAKWIVTAAHDTRPDMLWTNTPVADVGRLIVEVYTAATNGATEIKVRPYPMPKLAYAVGPTPDPGVMRDYIVKLTAFFIDNLQWVALAEEARGYVGAPVAEVPTEEQGSRNRKEPISSRLAEIEG